MNTKRIIIIILAACLSCDPENIMSQKQQLFMGNSEQLWLGSLMMAAEAAHDDDAGTTTPTPTPNN